jgi:hypothetical protein
VVLNLINRKRSDARDFHQGGLFFFENSPGTSTISHQLFPVHIPDTGNEGQGNLV